MNTPRLGGLHATGNGICRLPTQAVGTLRWGPVGPGRSLGGLFPAPVAILGLFALEAACRTSGHATPVLRAGIVRRTPTAVLILAVGAAAACPAGAPISSRPSTGTTATTPGASTLTGGPSILRRGHGR